MKDKGENSEEIRSMAPPYTVNYIHRSLLTKGDRCKKQIDSVDSTPVGKYIPEMGPKSLKTLQFSETTFIFSSSRAYLLHSSSQKLKK